MPPPRPGQWGLCNTTAAALSLGTGGFHFVLTVCDGPPPNGGAGPNPALRREDGHLIKLRYTALQGRVLAAEEAASPARAAIERFTDLGGRFVAALGLHSQLAPLLWAFARAAPGATVAFVMSDAGALPIGLSEAVALLRRSGLLHGTVTAGHAFGGDLEAVNVHAGIIAAHAALAAELVVVGPGPGLPGTGSRFGHGGIAQAEAVNAIAALGGTPVAVARLSFADPRSRHRGLSHHYRTALGRAALAPCVVPLPELPSDQAEVVRRQIALEPGCERHRIETVSDPIVAAAGTDAWAVEIARRAGAGEDAATRFASMGRGPADDPPFFAAAAAAGLWCARAIVATGDARSAT